MSILDWTGFSATPAGWMNSSNHSGGVADAQPPANLFQPFGLAARAMHRPIRTDTSMLGYLFADVSGAVV